MSKIRADNITNRQGTGSPIFPNGIRVVGLTSLSDVVAGIATFSGSVTVGGTLTYDDVTNIDSVGLITARKGINVTAGVSTFAANIDANANINANGNIVGDNSTNISGISSVTSTNFYGSGANLTGLDGSNITNGNLIANLDGSKITSGIVTSARLGGGTANATTFLNGAGQFAAAGGGGTEAYFYMGGAGQALTSATWARVACNTAYQDSVSGCDVSTNNGRYTIQTGHAGRYYFIGQCSTFANGNNITRADVKIYKNGAVWAGAYQHVISGGAGYARHVGPQIATMDNASVGDYYELWIVVSGTTVSLSMDGETSKSNYLMGWKIADA